MVAIWRATENKQITRMLLILRYKVKFGHWPTVPIPHPTLGRNSSRTDYRWTGVLQSRVSWQRARQWSGMLIST